MLTLYSPFREFQTPYTGCQPPAAWIHRGPEKEIVQVKRQSLRMPLYVHTWLQGRCATNSANFFFNINTLTLKRHVKFTSEHAGNKAKYHFLRCEMQLIKQQLG